MWPFSKKGDDQSDIPQMEQDMMSEQKKALLQPDEDGCYMGIIDAGYTEDEHPSESDLVRCREALEKLFAEVEATGEPISKADLMHLDKFGEPAMTFEETLRNFSWIVAKLKSTTGESFTVEELGGMEFGDNSEDHKKMTILQSAGEENLLKEMFKPENWVGRLEDCKQLHGMISDTYKGQVNLDEVVVAIKKIEMTNKLANTPPLTGDTSLTKAKLFAQDKDGFAAFDHPDNVAGLETLNTLLQNNNQGHIQFDDLAANKVQSGDSVLFHIVATVGIDAVIALSLATGEPLSIEHLTSRDNNSGQNSGKSVMDKIIERGELDKMFPAPKDDAPSSLIWVNRPRDMEFLWNPIPPANKAQLMNPGFETRLNLVNGRSLATMQKASGGIEL